ncbi:MAG: dipeptidase PepE [Chthoniobacterales bacterium]
MTTSGQILLISNSTVYGRGYLDHGQEEIRRVLKSRRTILFFPYALADHDAYAAKVRRRFTAMGYSLESIHASDAPKAAVAGADAFFIGGGNTFRLVKALQDLELIERIRDKVRSGTPYIGSSAGSNVAGLTIKTTNDMPIVQPHSFDALALVSFQLNPHFLDSNPNSKHMGETREERIIQFLEENETPVVGLREGAWLTIENSRVTVGGENGARIFRRGQTPNEAETGTEITSMVE